MIAAPKPGSRDALVWAKNSANRIAENLAVAYWADDAYHRRMAIEELGLTARYLGLRVVSDVATEAPVDVAPHLTDDALIRGAA